MAPRDYGQYSGVAAAAEQIGERWALLIVRDLLVGARRYTDLKQSLPRIPTNILSARLRELQDSGVVRRVPMRNCGLVYELTPRGRELEPVVLALERWGSVALRDPEPGSRTSADALTIALRAAFRADSAPDADYEVRVGDIVLRVQVRASALTIAQLQPPAPPVGGSLPDGDADVVIEAPGGIRDLFTAVGSAPDGETRHALQVVQGDPAGLAAFVHSFGAEGSSG
jgi:DNA-binding HxlR family transcriptional regulator